MKPRLALTMGDVNGIGPEILAKALGCPELRDRIRPVVFGSLEILRGLLAEMPTAPKLMAASTLDGLKEDDARVPVLECGQAIPPYQPGTLSAEAGRCAVEWLKEAVRLTQAGALQGIVTCPLNKEGIHKAGYTFAGHTDLIAEMTCSPDYRMCLFTDRMRIVHITGHLSLADAVRAVKQDRIARSIRLAHEVLTRLGLPRQRIAVAGLNPHAGESGAFGREEIEEILPAITACQAEGIDCSGPYSPDAVFRWMLDGAFDLVVAMYHDQGHIVLKLIAMDEGVNVTLGIPLVRTSVDHGTAYDIAGRGIAREQSLIAAIHLAAELASHPSTARDS